MGRWITVLTLLFLASTPAYGADFTWTDEQGKSFSLAELKGEPLVLHLWASWCPPCRTEMKVFSEWRDNNPSIKVVMVSLDQHHSDAAAFLKDKQIDRPALLSDTAQARGLGARAIPTTIIIAADGSISRLYHGAHDWSDDAFSKQVVSQLHP